MFSTLLKTATLGLLTLQGASAMSINKHHLVHRDVIQAVQIPDATSRPEEIEILKVAHPFDTIFRRAEGNKVSL